MCYVPGTAAGCTMFMVAFCIVTTGMAGSVGESLEPKSAPAPPMKPGLMSIGPDGKPQWQPIDLPPPPPGPPVEPTYHLMEGHAMGDDLKAGGRYTVDDEGNVLERPAEPTEPLTEDELLRASKVYPGVDMDRSGHWEEEEVVALYRAGNSREWFAKMDRKPRDGKVSQGEFEAYLPKLKPHRGTRSLRYTLRHLEKNVKGLEQDIAAARGCELTLLHYKRHQADSAASADDDPRRIATYQILVGKTEPDGDTQLQNLYVDTELPEGAKVTQAFYYREGNIRYGESPTQQCTQQGEAGRPVLVRCKIAKLLATLTIYIHASYGEDVYDMEQLQEMHANKATEVRAAVKVAGQVLKSAATEFLQLHDRDEV